MAQGIIFAYSYNKFHATLTTRAQNTISAPTCVPETIGFAALKFVGGILGNICQIPGVLQYLAPVHIYERQIPDPRELSIGQIPGGVPGGGMVTPGIDSCITAGIFLASILPQGAPL